MVNFLIAKGSDLKAVNKNNKTALDIAKERGLLRVVNEIKSKMLEEQKKAS